MTIRAHYKPLALLALLLFGLQQVLAAAPQLPQAELSFMLFLDHNVTHANAIILLLR